MPRINNPIIEAREKELMLAGVNRENETVQEEYIKVYTWRDKTFFLIIRQFLRNKTAVVGLIIVAILIMMAIFAPYLTNYSYKAVSPLEANQLPNSEHWFGTDNMGRDIYSRILYGARYSLSIGFAAETLGIVVGVILGALAGYFPGIVENIILRLCDILQNIPNTLLCIIISQALGGGVFPTLIALSIGGIPGAVRVLRATMMSVREQEFIEAAHSINCSNVRVMFKHIVPNCLAPIIISFSMGIGGKIMQSASLSFLGLGIQEPTPEWGAMISAGRAYIRYYPHMIIVPGIFVALVVLSFNMIGDGLRDALDPKLRS